MFHLRSRNFWRIFPRFPFIVSEGFIRTRRKDDKNVIKYSLGLINARRCIPRLAKTYGREEKISSWPKLDKSYEVKIGKLVSSGSGSGREMWNKIRSPMAVTSCFINLMESDSFSVAVNFRSRSAPLGSAMNYVMYFQDNKLEYLIGVAEFQQARPLSTKQMSANRTVRCWSVVRLQSVLLELR